MVFVVVGAGFVAVLVDLQTVRPEFYREIGEDQRTRTRQIAGNRGNVVDRNGVVLAGWIPSHTVVADPTLVTNPAVTAALLAPVLDVDEATLTDLLSPDSAGDRYSLLARDLDDEAVAQLEQLEADGEGEHLRGIYIRPEEDRVYPAGDLAWGLVGRVDPDEQGIYGLEAVYNEVMTGVPGSEQFERGRFGSISVGDREVDPATAGHDVVVTIDSRIQYVAERTLLDHCERTGANRLTAVAGDPRTGEILAMASVVADDEGGCRVPEFNTAVIDAFEPGSVVKPMIVAAAAEELSYNASTVVEVPPRITVGGKRFSDHPSHPAAPYTIADILADSMNVGTILVSQRLPDQTIYRYLRDFGYASDTGLGLPGETSGLLRPPEEWWGADRGSIPIGQGMTVNAVQLLSAYNVLANDGTFVAPTLVRSLEGPDGTVTEPPPGERHAVVSAAAAREVTTALVEVVERGTGAEAAVDGFVVAGKTGTAWKVFDDGSGRLGYGSDGNRRYVMSFAGFLPADEPALSLVVVVDEPDHGDSAGQVAAPIFAEIADYGARILGLVPDDGTVVGSTGADGLVRAAPAPGADAGPGAVATDVAAEPGPMAAPPAADPDGRRRRRPPLRRVRWPMRRTRQRCPAGDRRRRSGSSRDHHGGGDGRRPDLGRSDCPPGRTGVGRRARRPDPRLTDGRAGLGLLRHPRGPSRRPRPRPCGRGGRSSGPGGGAAARSRGAPGRGRRQPAGHGAGGGSGPRPPVGPARRDRGDGNQRQELGGAGTGRHLHRSRSTGRALRHPHRCPDHARGR